MSRTSTLQSAEFHDTKSANRFADCERPTPMIGGNRVAAERANRGGVQSVERAFELLEVLADAGGTAALGELAARTDLPQPTIHRLVRTLLAMGYVRQLPNRQYSLGPKLIRLGESAAQLIGAWARQHLAGLVE
ncbi:MAG: IclR family transcriptional regulator, acetate operon repressor, partial [Mycobacterium sp.]|nr:IclR family transcriptional regulator, acetate operon repressor [Mycobacterium sp.]